MKPTFADDLNLPDYFLFDREKEGRGGRIALRFGDRTWTYTQVADRARSLAKFLVAAGLKPEQRVYLVLPDTPAFAWSIFGILAAGGVLCLGNSIAPTEYLAYGGGGGGAAARGAAPGGAAPPPARGR